MGPDRLPPEWVSRIGGQVVSPAEGTCRGSRGERSLLDFFVVAAALAPSVLAVQVMEDRATSPHFPVRLALRSGARRRLIRTLVRPAPFPLEAEGSRGVAPADTGELRRAIALADSHGQSAIDRAYGLFCSLAEGELCDLHGVPECRRSRHSGRGERPRFAWKSAVGPPAKPFPRCSATGRAWRWLADRFCEIGWLGQSARPKAASQRAGLCRLLARWQGPLHQLPEWHDPWRARAAEAEWQWKETLLAWAEEARALAAKEETAFAKARKESWHEWVRNDTGGGLHRFAKGPRGWAPDPSGNGAPLAGQEAAEAALQEWAAIWRAGEFGPADTAELEARPLPPLTGSRLREVAKQFKKRTALGADSWHPRAFAALSEGLLDALAALFTAMERTGTGPSAIRLLMMVFLPKPTGGHRPIGLLVGLLRLWGKARRALCDEWELERDRPYFAGCQGRSSERAVWVQGFWSELAARMGLVSCSGLFDLTKAYERVRHDLLVPAAIEAGIPWTWLRLVLWVYAGPRVAVLEGAVSAELATDTTIVAGCSGATTLLKAFIIAKFDAIVAKYPTLRYCVMVDDMTIAASGTVARVLRSLPRALHALWTALAAAPPRGRDLQVSGAKSVAISSDPEVGRRVVARVGSKRMRLVTATKNLGVDDGAGKATPRTVAAGRLRAVASRVPRLRMLRKAGLVKGRLAALARSGAVPAATYGAKVTGYSDAMLDSLRTTVGKTLFADNHGSLSLSYLLLQSPRVDPAFLCNREPLVAWAAAWWEQRVPRSSMLRAFRRAAGNTTSWTHCRGPAGATVLTLRRLGWRAGSGSEWTDDRGQSFTLDSLGPWGVGKLADESTERWLWKKACATDPGLGEVGGHPLLGPARRLLAARDTSAPGAAYLRSVITGAQWTQAKLASQRQGEPPTCLACGAEDGTLRHRHFRCDAGLVLRRQERADPFFDTVAAAGARSPDEHPFFGRALVRDPALAFPPPREEEALVWVQEPPGGGFEGEVFTDGSNSDPCDCLTGRAGCGVAALGADGVLLGRLCAAVPGPTQDPLKAELWGLLLALRFAVGQLTVRPDCSVLVKGVAKGRKWCTAWNRPHAEVWQRIWWALDDIGTRNVEVEWTKGHVKATAAGRSAAASRAKRGNDAADALARRGAALHPAPSHQARSLRAAAREAAGALCRWLTRLGRVHIVHGVRDVDLRPERRRAAGGWSLEVLPPGVEVDNGHQVSPLPGRRWGCSRCGHALASRAGLTRRACTGVPPLAARADASHSLWALGRVIFCTACGAYGARRSPLLLRPCRRGCSGRSAEGGLARLRDGRHPATGHALGVPVRLGVPPHFPAAELRSAGSTIAPGAPSE